MVAGGTVSAIAAVLSYHPAQLSTGLLTSSAPLGSATATNQQTVATPTTSASATTATQTPSAAPSTSTSATKSGTKKNKSKQSSTNGGNAANATATNSQPAPSATPSSSQSQAPAQTTTPPPASPPATTKTAGASQTIAGPVISTRWGPVQVEIVVDNGQIISATGLQYPHGDRRSSYISQQAIPMLVDLTLQAQSATGMQGVGGATYTSNGWKLSLAAALTNI